ncbi:ZCHC3 protein, partial [Atractosteus spatula]|nr:ZCHC3 protein [Atractosteus spatula]
MFNEMVMKEDIVTWLSKYCLVKDEPQKVLDDDGIWNCSWRVPILLYEDKNGYCGFKHISSLIGLGENRGLVFYQGQPKLCRRCGELGHFVDACTKVVCGKCKEIGHAYTECTSVRKCSLCECEGHVFKDCPNSFANRTKLGRPMQKQEEFEEAFRAGAVVLDQELDVVDVEESSGKESEGSEWSEGDEAEVEENDNDVESEVDSELSGSISHRLPPVETESAQMECTEQRVQSKRSAETSDLESDLTPSGKVREDHFQSPQMAGSPMGLVLSNPTDPALELETQGGQVENHPIDGRGGGGGEQGEQMEKEKGLYSRCRRLNDSSQSF